MGNHKSKITKKDDVEIINNEEHKVNEEKINAQIEKEIVEIDEISKISAIHGESNFISNETVPKELRTNLAGQPEVFIPAENEDQMSTISEVSALQVNPDGVEEDPRYKEEKFLTKKNLPVSTQIVKSTTTACIKGAGKFLSSKWSFIGAGAIAIYEVSGIYSLYKDGKIKGKEFAKHLGRATTTTLSCIVGANIGFKLGVTLGIVAGIPTGGIAIIAAGILGAFFGGSIGSLLSGTIYDSVIDVKSEEELKILSSREYYMKALKKYEANEDTSMDELRKKRKDIIRSYHPDKFIDQRLKEKFSEKLIKYMQYFEVIRVYRGVKN